jgi:hypothetical protein
MTALERALQELARAAPKDFVVERKRLAAALRPRDEGAAARLELRRKPAASVWAVNQLYWHARDDFDRLPASSASLRMGDLDARRAHRDALSTLHQAAAQEAGLGAADAILRRDRRRGRLRPRARGRAGEGEARHASRKREICVVAG